MEIQVDTNLKINSLKKKNKENTTKKIILRNIKKKTKLYEKIYSDYKSKKVDILSYLMQTRTNI
jgi:hypothetical protein